MILNVSTFPRSWNKKLNYVIAIAKDGVYDVTKRYTKKWHDVLIFYYPFLNLIFYLL